METRGFSQIDLADISELASAFAAQHSRRISSVHLHHTYVPNQQLFHQLARQLGSEQAAGQELCQRMWRFHTQDKRWSDIAQHVTIDPAGTIWLGRPWAMQPASASGFNGNPSLGPFMIEMIGNFDTDQEVLEGAQLDATYSTIIAIQSAFELKPADVYFHNELNNRKSCPGNAISKSIFVKELTARHKQLKADQKNVRDKRHRSPFDSSRIKAGNVHGSLLDALLTPSSPISDSEMNGELAEHLMSPGDIRALSATNINASTRGRGVRDVDTSLTPLMAQQLKPHVINLEQGQFSSSGDFKTSKLDVDNMIDDKLTAWITTQLENNRTPRVMIHAHGGLNDESHGLAYAYQMHRWWLDQHIYPIYFVWETGTLETIFQMLEEYKRQRNRGFLDDLADTLKDAATNALDTALEYFIHKAARDPWTTMKISAERASDSLSNSGAHYLATKLNKLHQDFQSIGAIEFHAIGHSAGAIFQAYFMRECNENGKQVPIESLSLMAPACTVELFNELIKPRIQNHDIKRFHLYALDEQTERRDPTVPIYSKSLLHLVSQGFESKQGTALLGMQKFIKRDQSLASFLGLGGDASEAVSVIYSPSGNAPSTINRSNATTHGGFSTDKDTQVSIALRIRRENDATDFPAFPVTRNVSRSTERLFPALSERIDEDVYRALFSNSVGANDVRLGINQSTQSPTGSVPLTSSVTHSQPLVTGMRHALCIGIDEYAGDARLFGCVNDAELWARHFNELGFKTRVMRDREATHANILNNITSLVKEAAPGDIVAVQYAGHGIQFDDADGDEADGKDEALVPYDHNGGLYVSDDELWDAIEAGQDGVLIYVFMDCCHSRSNMRGLPQQMTPGELKRLIHPDPTNSRAHRARKATLRTRSKPSDRTTEKQRHIKYSACKDKELAKESNGHGKFTLAAIAALNSSSGSMSNLAFREHVLNSFEGDIDQHPGLECPNAWRSGLFLGGIV